MACPQHVGETPAVTVLCTVRDGMPYLPATLESVLAQSMPDFECIIVDDGSTDGTAAYLAEAAARDARIRVLSPGPVGRGAALVLASEASRAPWLAVVDADDPSHPDRLGHCLAWAERHQEFDVVAVRAETLHGNADAPAWQGALPSPGEVAWRDVTLDVGYRNPLVHAATLIRRDALAAVGGYDAQRQSQFDYDLWVRLALAGYRMARLDVPLVAKRLHVGQSFERRDAVRYAWRSARVQGRAIRGLQLGSRAYVSLVARLAWRTLPQSARAVLRRAAHRLRRGGGDPS